MVGQTAKRQHLQSVADRNRNCQLSKTRLSLSELLGKDAKGPRSRLVHGDQEPREQEIRSNKDVESNSEAEKLLQTLLRARQQLEERLRIAELQSMQAKVRTYQEQIKAEPMPEFVEIKAPAPEKQELITSPILLEPSVGQYYQKDCLLREPCYVFAQHLHNAKTEFTAECVGKKLVLCAPPAEIETADAASQKATKAEEKKAEKKVSETEEPVAPNQTISLSQQIPGAAAFGGMPMSPGMPWYVNSMCPPSFMGKGGKAPAYPSGKEYKPSLSPVATALFAGDAEKVAKGNPKAKAVGKAEAEGKGTSPVHLAYAAAKAAGGARAASGMPDQFASAVALGHGQSLDEEQKSNLRAPMESDFTPHHNSVPKTTDLASTFGREANAPSTTGMLRNIPNKYKQDSLLQEIDKEGFENTYDFFYLPMDMVNRSNVGYAFINFKSPGDLQRFTNHFNQYSFQRIGSRKKAMVSPATVQGLKQNVLNLMKRKVAQGQFRPLVIMNGKRVDLEEAAGPEAY